MAAPFPYDAVAGVANDGAEFEAANLQGHFVWLARWSDEMDGDVDLDLKKLAQFVLHCRAYRRWFDALAARGGPARAVIAGYFAHRKCAWATLADMVQDLQAIYDAAGVAADWIEANLAGYKGGYTMAVVIGADANGVPITSDVPVKAVKPPAFATRVAAFRGLFNAKG
jgi:hypothetical protein